MLHRATLLGTLLGLLCIAAAGQTSGTPAQKDDTTVRAEARLVLVDAIVTDKRGGYVGDLALKDFRVWEDNKEVAVKNFSYEASPGSPQRERYLVLFFDNATMSFTQRAAAKEAATKFIQANAGPKQLMAVVNFGGALQISQNFTSNADRLVKVVNSQTGTPVVLGSAASPIGSAATEVNSDTSLASTGMVGLSSAELDFGTRSVLLALRSLAKNLATLPGRKTLVFLTAGFQISADRWPELESVISQCNKANVAIYPVDARGLVGPGSSKLRLGPPPPANDSGRFVSAVYRPGTAKFVFASGQSRPPVNSGGGQSGGTGGGTAPSGGTNPGRAPTPPPSFPSTPPVRTGPPRTPGGILIPPSPIVPTDNQAVLETLARGTGGFVIKNTNDLLSGMQKIGQEQNQYYILSFTPAPSKEGSCHALKVKVERSGVDVRSRSGYCNLKSIDMLAGTPQEKELQARVDSQGGVPPAGLSLPFFYTAPNTAKVNLATEIPSSVWKFSNEKGKFHAVANVLGVAYKQDGSVAARFSDSVTLDLDNKKQVEDLAKKPYRYEKQFLIASGEYTLKVVFSGGGENFGKLESRLKVEPFQDGQFSLSAVALSTEIVDLQQNPALLSQALLDDRTPLVYDGYQIVPSIMNRFKRSDIPILYAEIYEPLLLGADAPTVMVQYQIVDRASGAIKLDTGMFKPQVPIKVGNPVITVGLKMRSDKLGPGAYRVLFRASDSAGKTTMDRSADFDVVD